MKSAAQSAAIRLVPLLLTAVFAYVFWRQLHGLTLAQVLTSVTRWGTGRAVAALSLTAAAYFMLVMNEQVGLRWAGARVRLRSGVTASFIAHALANNLGMGVLAGGALRVSVFTRYGVSLVQVAKITAYGTATFSLGVATLAGLSFLLSPPGMFAALGVEPLLGRGLGLLLVATPGLYVGACALFPAGFILFKHEFRPPVPLIALTQIAFGVVDVSLGSALLWVLLGPAAPPYPTFVAAYLVSVTLGLLSGVPGGMGVFETFMGLLLPSVDRGAVIAALLGYRLFYYIAPLVPALVLLLVRRSHRVAPPGA